MISMMKQAEGVLSAMKRLMPETTVDDGLGGKEDLTWYEPYLNGREKGFLVEYSPGYKNGSRTDRKVAFSEIRNGDGIVVYAGGYKDFGWDNNPRNEKTWTGRKHFNHKEYEKAARYAIKMLGLKPKE